MLQTIVDPRVATSHQLTRVLVRLPRAAQHALPRHVQHGVRDEDYDVGRARPPANHVAAEKDLEEAVQPALRVVPVALQRGPIHQPDKLLDVVVELDVVLKVVGVVASDVEGRRGLLPKAAESECAARRSFGNFL